MREREGGREREGEIGGGRGRESPVSMLVVSAIATHSGIEQHNVVRQRKSEEHS